MVNFVATVLLALIFIIAFSHVLNGTFGTWLKAKITVQ